MSDSKQLGTCDTDHHYFTNEALQAQQMPHPRVRNNTTADTRCVGWRPVDSPAPQASREISRRDKTDAWDMRPSPAETGVWLPDCRKCGKPYSAHVELTNLRRSYVLLEHDREEMYQRLTGEVERLQKEFDAAIGILYRMPWCECGHQHDGPLVCMSCECEEQRPITREFLVERIKAMAADGQQEER